MPNVHTVDVRFKADKARRDADKFDKSMGKLDKKMGGLAGTMGKLTGVMGAIGFGLAAADMFKTIVATEQMKASLQTMTGSVENANAAFGALNEFAKTTPFTMDQSVNAFVKMKSLGLDPTAAALSSFGNTASAMGKDLNQMIEAVADAVTGENERLKEFGIKAKDQGDTVAYTFQGVTTEVGKNAEEITGYLQSIGEEHFGDAMALQMERLPGKLSNLRDNVQNLWRAFGESGVTEVMGDIVSSVSAGIEKITLMVTSGFAGESVKILLDQFTAPFKEAFAQIAASFGMTGDDMIKTMKHVLGFIPVLFGEVIDWVALLPRVWQATVTTILEIGGAMLANWGDEFAMLSTSAEIAWENIKYAGGLAWDYLRLGFTKMIDAVLGGLASALEKIGGMVANLPGMGGMAAQILGAAGALETLAEGEAAVRLEMDATKLAHEAQIAAMQTGQEALAKVRADREAVAVGNSEAAWAEVAAEKELMDARQLQAEMMLTQVKAGKTWQEILDDLAKSNEKAAGGTDKLTAAQKKFQKQQESLTKKLQPYLDKIRGITEAERDEMTALTLLGQAMALGIIDPATEAIPLLEALKEGLKGTAEESENWHTAMARQVERLDDLFGNMWQDFLTDGMGAFSGLVDGMKSMIGEMQHSISTQPIMLELKKGMDGEEMDWSMEGAGGAVLSAVGVMGGTALGGGGQGAAMGAALGSIAGMYFGPIGSMVGGVLGGLVGGMFDSDPKLTAGAGSQAGKSNYGSDLGGIWIAKGQGGGGDIKNDVGQAIQELDNLVASFLDDDQIAQLTEKLKGWKVRLKGDEVTVDGFVGGRLDAILGGLGNHVTSFVNEAGKLEDRVERLVVALTTMEVMADNPDLFGGTALDEVLAAVDLMTERGETAGQALERLGQAMEVARFATEVLTEYVATDLNSAYSESVRMAGRTLKEVLMDSGDQVRELASLYDETAGSVERLAAAVQSRYQLEFQMLVQLDTVAQAVSDRFGNLKDQISGTINPPTIDDSTAILDDLMGQLAEASDPAEVDRLTARIEAVARGAWGALPEDMKAAMGQQFLDMLTEADRLAQDRIDKIREQVIEESALLREEIGVLMEGVTDPFHLVINELGIAAEMLQLAADRLGGGDGVIGVGDDDYLGGGVGDRPGYDKPNSADLTTAANTLTTEGAAYRASQATMTQALSAAIASIPNRIVVNVTAPRASEFI